MTARFLSCNWVLFQFCITHTHTYVCVCIYIYIYILEMLAVIGKFQLLIHRTSNISHSGKLAKFLKFFVSRQGILNSGRNEMLVLRLDSTTLQTGWAYSAFR
jgi:hypothetical protein